MNVLIDARLPDSSVGGIQVVIQCLAKGFSESEIEHNHNFRRFWLVYENTTWWEKYIPVNDNIIETKFPFGKLGVFLLRRYPKYLSKIRPIYSVIFRFPKYPFDKLLNEKSIDLVHQPFQDSFRTKFKSIWHPHDLQHIYFPEFFSKSQIKHRNRYWRKNAEHANLIICETPLIKNDVIKTWDINSKKIEIVPTPPLPRLNLDSEQILKLPKRFLYYPAAFWPHKNHFRLIQAFDQLRKEGFDVSLVLTGAKNGVYNEVVNLTHKLKLEENIFFLGHVSDDQVAHIFNSCEIVVIPTLHESLSLPVWEAWIYGKPLAYSKIDYLPFQVDGTGFGFNPYDIDSITATLRDIFDRKVDLEFTEKRSKEKLMNLTPEYFAKSCFQLYCKVLNYKLEDKDKNALIKLQQSIGYSDEK
jgi:glycosyltransferase involved in cell wall biosynthesis